MPWYAAVFLMISLSSIAVPGFNGFVGEFLILVGAWPFSPTLVVLRPLRRCQLFAQPPRA